MTFCGQRRAAAGAAVLGGVLLTVFSLQVLHAQDRAPSLYDAPFVPGEVLVSYRSSSTFGIATRQVANPKQQLALVAQSIGGRVRESLANGSVARIDLPYTLSVPEAVEALSRNPQVQAVQPNYIYTQSAEPNDPYFTNGTQWALKNQGQNGGTAGADIGAVKAWDTTTGSSEIVVGVIDSGVDYNHPDLAANIYKNTGEIAGNGIDDDGNGYVDDVNGWNGASNSGNPMDDNGHGTHVAGTIGAVSNNGTGVSGVAWNVKIVPLKFLAANGSGSTSAAIACIDYLNKLKDKGVNVVASNNSWGGSGSDSLLKQAIDRAGQRGILFIAAAGNDGANNDTTANYPANYDSANIISVAATDRNDQLASFSNYGANSVELGAPGVDITNLYPGSRYATMSGTSMATPHVTGATVLVKAANPSLTGAQIKARILETGDSVASLAGKTITGKRLNVAHAVATSGTTPTPTPTPAPSPTATLSLAASRTTYTYGQTVSFGATLKNQSGSSISGAPVLFTLVQNGSGYQFNRTTDSQGYAPGSISSLYLKRGTYTLSAKASPSGYAAVTTQTTITIR